MAYGLVNGSFIVEYSVMKQNVSNQEVHPSHALSRIIHSVLTVTGHLGCNIPPTLKSRL